MTRIPSYEFRRLLEDTPVSSRAIAEAAGVSETTVYRWRHGDSLPAVAHVRDVLDLHEKVMNDLTKRLAAIRRHVGYMREMAGLDGERSPENGEADDHPSRS